MLTVVLGFDCVVTIVLVLGLLVIDLVFVVIGLYGWLPHAGACLLVTCVLHCLPLWCVVLSLVWVVGIDLVVIVGLLYLVACC